MERRTPWLGYLCVILSAVIFGCMPLGANFLYAQGVTCLLYTSHLVFGHFALHAFLFFKPCPLEGMYCGGSIQFDTPGFVVKQSELHLSLIHI